MTQQKAIERLKGLISAIVLCVTEALSKTSSLPPVTPTERTGEWVSLFDGNEWFIHCSKCKTQHYEEDLLMGGSELPDYCSNCGAYMRGDKECQNIVMI